MRQINLVLVFVFFLSNSGNTQTINYQSKLTGNIQNDLKILLPNSKVKAEIMDGVAQTQRQVELTKKFQAAIKENYDWFMEQIKIVPEGKPVPYNEKLGLTKDEYTEFLGFMKNIELVSTGQEDIFIEIKNDMIYFKSHHKLSDLDSLTIDLKNNIAHFGLFKLTFADSINITNDQNGLKSKWKGYKWKFEEPANLDISDFNDLTNLNVKQYTLTIGQLEKNGNTYMSLKGREIEDGEKTVEFELPVIFPNKKNSSK